MNYYLGIDIGSFETKGTLIDAKGNMIAVHHVPHIMETPSPGFAEHDAEKTWWHDVCEISKALLKKTDIPAKEIKGIGCSAIAPCCLPVDKEGRPLRKAILYGVDVRASKQIEDLNRELGEDYVLEKYGNPITSQSIGPKILWIKENEPEIYAKTDKFVTSTTYVVAKLTGQWCIDHYTAAYFTPMYNLQSCDWDYENLERFCKAEQLAKCMWTDEIAGVVTKKASEETGLAEGTPVIVGTADAAADGVGAGVLNPGDMLIMFGSSIYMIHVVPELITDKRYWAGPYLFKDTYMVASGMSTAGTLTRWFRDEFAPDFVERQTQTGENAYDLLMEEIEEIPSGADGLIVLPYFSGERTPINDPKAKGVIFGLTLKHSRAHVYQACMEGVAYGIAQHLQGYREIGMETKRIIAVGGGTKTPKWMQIVSDTAGRDMLIGGVYGAAYGDALLAAKAAGEIKSREELGKFVSFNAEVKANPNKTAVYAPYLENYKKLYEITKDIMHSL